MRIGYNSNTEKYSNFTAVILAAGLSSRMKAFKPLLPVDGRTAVEGLIEVARAAGVEQIVVVTGHQREKLQPLIRKHGAVEAFNAGYEQGMFSSIKTGLAQAKALSVGRATHGGCHRAVSEGNFKGVLLMPVDCPLISINVLRSLMDGAGHFAVPVYEGKKGHPLFIASEYIDEICRYDGSGGLKAITDKYWDRMNRVAVNEEACILDMDTPEGYEEIKSFVSMGFRRTKLDILAARRRFILIRHGETRQHEGPVFTGQYDVPLSDKGRAQMEQTGEKIADVLAMHFNGDRKRDFFGNEIKSDMPDWSNTIYCSDLVRARDSADIIARCIRKKGLMVDDEENGVMPTGISVKALEGLREINLGEWDGRSIAEIKSEFPEEYERRGRDIFVFKTGNKSENFYDMQYRAIKCLREIISGDDGKNIVIVAHSGVIRAIENNLRGLRVDDDWDSLAKAGYREIELAPEL